MIRFLEVNGYDVTYATSTDLHSRPQVFSGRKVLVSDHHSEYWSGAMRDNVTAARDQGMSLAFFDANDMFWQIRFEGERTEVCYKDAALDPLSTTQPELTTVTWRKPPVNRPENGLFGVMFEWYVDYNVTLPWTVVNSSHWLYAGTGLLRALVASARPDRLLIRVPVRTRHWHVPLRAELGLEHRSDPQHFVEYEPEEFVTELKAAGLEPSELQVRWGEIWATARPS